MSLSINLLILERIQTPIGKPVLIASSPVGESLTISLEMANAPNSYSESLILAQGER